MVYLATVENLMQQYGGEEHRFQSPYPTLPLTSLPLLTSCVTLGKLLNLSLLSELSFNSLILKWK